MSFLRDREGKIPWVNILLFAATWCTTTLIGTVLMASFNNTVSDDLLGEIRNHPSILVNGLPFSVAIMTILFAHEMGHYFTCLYYGIDATLPYFIPSPLGTMGAFIKIRSPFQHRGALLDVGVAGPIAGFVLAVPTLVIGLIYSKIVAADPTAEGIVFGEPLIFKIVTHLVGKTPPPGMDIYLHPIAIAAWFGCLATALNLLPAGQLDGGHMTYAFFPNLHKWITLAVMLILIPLGFLYWQGWLVWAAFLLFFFIRMRHPMTIEEDLPLERRHLWLGIAGLIMFILCFMPMPIRIQ